RNDQMISGRTRQGKLIHFPVSEQATRQGSLVSVDVTYGAPYYLLGELRSVLRSPRHKIRVPLLSSR
ncbi:MAG TPA: tRNA (N6-isopentenyl adenosine(37)-C2)-methylthiotransferase MiaB, partial [Acidimicrobiales bacterium]